MMWHVVKGVLVMGVLVMGVLVVGVLVVGVLVVGVFVVGVFVVTLVLALAGDASRSMTVGVSPVAYGLATLIGALVAVGLCIGARRRPGPWTVTAARALAVILIGEQVTWEIQSLVNHAWTLTNSLPLDLCDFTTYVAAVACWYRVPVAVELTWFWGLAGTLQAIITPDVETPFPHLGFELYVVEHLAIVVAAVYLVIGLRIVPRPGAVLRTFALTVAYAAVCAVVDIATGADYLFLRAPPVAFSLLQVLGPWPWYLVSCAGIALVAFFILDAPFHRWHRQASPAAQPESIRGR
jgi:hypothetical integral membrane protein (TIGR02206 family)